MRFKLYIQLKGIWRRGGWAWVGARTCGGVCTSFLPGVVLSSYFLGERQSWWRIQERIEFGIWERERELERENLM